MAASRMNLSQRFKIKFRARQVWINKAPHFFINICKMMAS